MHKRDKTARRKGTHLRRELYLFVNLHLFLGPLLPSRSVKRRLCSVSGGGFRVRESDS